MVIMCGFVGFWGFRALKHYDISETAQKMAQNIPFRGPDGDGIWVDAREQLALAHRRLAIVDISPTGAQPMISALGRYVMTYNGEVYNALELRKELLQLGYTFKGTSDTEVMLAAIEEWGLASAVRRFIGMFAFALWDRESRTLALVRDRLGVKPLYYGTINHILFFGSQLRAFYPHPEWKGEVHHQALESYFHLHYIPSPLSIYRHIYKQLPGTIVCFYPDGSSKIETYWDLENISDPLRINYAITETEVVEQLHQLLLDSVQKQLVCDVPLGAFLSGGIDSSIVASLMQAQRTDPVQTFSVKFTEDAFDESVYAERIAKHLGTNHQTFVVTSKDAQNVIPYLSEWFDEPFADVSQIPTYLIAKMARQHVTVCLSGDGGDEIFGGYYRYQWSRRLWSILKWIPLWVRQGMAYPMEWLCANHANTLGNWIPLHMRPSQGLSDKIQKVARIFDTPNEAQIILRLADQLGTNHNVVTNTQPYMTAYAEQTGLKGLAHAQYCDMRAYLPDDILTKVDRATMAVSLEGRVPLLDHRVVEWSWRLPPSMKIRRGITKWPLRKVLEKYIPKELFDRPKMGFNVPLAGWLRTDLKEWAQDLLHSQTLDRFPYIQKDILLEQWNQHQSGPHNHHNVIWATLMLIQWSETYSTKTHF